MLLLQVGVMAAVGPVFGLSRVAAARAGLLLAAGGEFAFVAFGEAQSLGILPAAMVRELFLVVALSMALTPFLADLGQRLGKMFEKNDMKVGTLSVMASVRCPAEGVRVKMDKISCRSLNSNATSRD
jgi:Kef-type K+ transport system membrane component KefB